MDNLCSDKQRLVELVKYGKYYNPAYQHYGQEGIVYCDKCNKQDLSVCIGYETFDLCLNCVQEIVDCMSKPGICPCVKKMNLNN